MSDHSAPALPGTKEPAPSSPPPPAAPGPNRRSGADPHPSLPLRSVSLSEPRAPSLGRMKANGAAPVVAPAALASGSRISSSVHFADDSAVAGPSVPSPSSSSLAAHPSVLRQPRPVTPSQLHSKSLPHLGSPATPSKSALKSPTPRAQESELGEPSRPSPSASPRPASRSQASLKRPQSLSRSGSEIIEGKRPSSLLGGYESSGSDGGGSSDIPRIASSSRRRGLIPTSRSQGASRPLSQDVADLEIGRRAKSLASNSLDGLRKTASARGSERTEKRAKTSRLDELVARRQPGGASRSASLRVSSAVKPKGRSASVHSTTLPDGEVKPVASESGPGRAAGPLVPAPPAPRPSGLRQADSAVLDPGTSSPSSLGSRKGKEKESFPGLGGARFGGGMQSTVLDAASIHLFLNELSKRDATLAASEADDMFAPTRARSSPYSPPRRSQPGPLSGSPSAPHREPFVPLAPPRLTAGEEHGGPGAAVRDRTVSSASTSQPRMHMEWKSRERSGTVDSSLNSDPATPPWHASSAQNTQRRRSARLSISQDGGHVPYTHPVPHIMVNQEESDIESAGRDNGSANIFSDSPNPARRDSSVSTLPTVDAAGELTPDKEPEKLGKKHKRLSGLFASLKRKPSIEDKHITRTRTVATYHDANHTSPNAKREAEMRVAAGHSTPEHHRKHERTEAQLRETQIKDKERERREREILQENRFKAETELQAHPVARQKGIQVATHLNNYYRYIYEGMESPPAFSPLSVLRWRALRDRRDEQERQWRDAKRNGFGYGASPSDPSLNGFSRSGGPINSASAGRTSYEAPSLRSYGGRSGTSSRKDQAGELKWGWFMPIGAAWYFTINNIEEYQACDGEVHPFRPPLEASPSPSRSGGVSISSGKRANGLHSEVVEDKPGDIPSRTSIDKKPVDDMGVYAQVVAASSDADLHPAPSIADLRSNGIRPNAFERDGVFPQMVRGDSDMSGSSVRHGGHRHTQSLGHSHSLRRRFGGRRSTHQAGDDGPSDSAADDVSHRLLGGLTRRNNSVMNLLSSKRNNVETITDDEPRNRRTSIVHVLSGTNLRGMNDDRHWRAGSAPTTSTRGATAEALVTAGGLFTRGGGGGEAMPEAQARHRREMQTTLDQQTARAMQARFDREHQAEEMKEQAQEAAREKAERRAKLDRELGGRRQRLKTYHDQVAVLDTRLAGHAASLQDWTAGLEHLIKAFKQAGDIDLDFPALKAMSARYAYRGSFAGTEEVQSPADVHSRSSTLPPAPPGGARPRRRGTLTSQSMSGMPPPVVLASRRATIILSDGKRLDPLAFAEWNMQTVRERYRGLNEIANTAYEDMAKINKQVQSLLQERSQKGLVAQVTHDRIKRLHGDMLALRRRLQGPKFSLTVGRRIDGTINILFQGTLWLAAAVWFLLSGFIFGWHVLVWAWRHKLSLLCALLAAGIPSMAAWQMGYLDWVADLRVWLGAMTAHLLSGVIGRWLWVAWTASSRWTAAGAWTVWQLLVGVLGRIGVDAG